jgi:putative acetyltransferase
VRALIGELDATLAAEYPPEQRHGIAIDALFAPHMRFFVAHLGDAAAGCGGVALFADFAEVKRMYVRPAVRGQGVAQALLARIEAETRAAGLPLLRLETGIRQPAAITLYERAGFTRCAAFGDYLTLPPASIATSLFYEKRLTAAAG